MLAAEVVVRNLALDHYLVADREGSVATVVFFDGELVARTGDDLPVGVFTNSPYAEMIELWRTHGASGASASAVETDRACRLPGTRDQPATGCTSPCRINSA